MKLLSKQYQALVQERADLVAEGKRLFDRAEADNRALTAEEAKRDDEINARLEAIKPELKRHEDRRARETSIETPATAVATAEPGGDDTWEALRADTMRVDKLMRGGAKARERENPLAQFMRMVGATSIANRITGGDERAAAKPFGTLGENLLAAVQFAKSHELPTAYRQYNANIERMYAASGLNEGLGSEGGILVQTDFIAGLLRPLHEDGPFYRRTRNIPVSADANGVVINAVSETSRATGSRWGGIRGYRLAEGNPLTAGKPDFRRMELRLKKYGVLAYSTDELLKDSSALEAVLNQGAGEEIDFLVNDDLLNGLGVSGALGVLVSPALVTVSKEAGQAAATVVNANLNKMWQRLHPRYRANAAWFINSEVEPQLDVLTIPAGVAALEPRYVTYGPDGVMRIKGKPVIVTEFNAALGTVGDIVLADWSDYVTIDKGGVQTATSIHVQFLTDEQVFRFIYRCDGQPSLNSPITPYKGTNTQSAYVALETRS